MLLSLVYINCDYLQAQTTIPRFEEGERVVFVGNSITHGGHYHSFIWLYYMTRFPDKPITIMNAGIGGESAWDMKDRLDYDVFNRKPTYVTLTFGMNDTGYDIYMKDDAKELSEQRIAKSLESYREIEERLLAKNKIKKVLIGGSPYDETSRFNNFILRNKNNAILKIIDAQRTSAKKNGWGFVDFNQPMREISRKEQEADSTFTFCRIDRIHPDNDGQMVMAYLFLKAQGLAGDEVSSVSIDAHHSSVITHKNCKISKLKKSGADLTFDYLAYALPYPLDSISRSGWGNKRSQRDAMRLVPFMEEFNQERFQVTNLEKGMYRLTIDNQFIDNLSSEKLANGVNLADYPNTPQYQQAAKIMYLNEERCAIEKRLRQYMAMQYVFFKHRGLLFADNKAALDAAKAERESHYLVKYLYTNYTQAMFPQIREAWQAEIDQLITQIYKINKPLTRLIKIERIKE